MWLTFVAIHSSFPTLAAFSEGLLHRAAMAALKCRSFNGGPLGGQRTQQILNDVLHGAAKRHRAPGDCSSDCMLG
jgi:hypothetical protein